MCWNSVYRVGAAFVVCASMVAVVTGCGSSEQDEEQRWVNEVILVNRSFVQTNKKTQQEELKANNLSEVASIYGNYTDSLRDQLQRVEEIDTPPACREEQKSMEQFVRRNVASAEELSKADQISRQELVNIVRGELASRRALVRDWAKLIRNNSC